MRVVPDVPRQRPRTDGVADGAATDGAATDPGDDLSGGTGEKRRPVLPPVGRVLDERRPAADDRTGPARVDLRGARLTARLAPGDVAVIDQLDIDLVTATALVSRQPTAVVNVTSSASGRSPALGAAALVAAGIRLVDGAGPQLLAALDDGDRVTVAADGRIMRSGVTVATGTTHDEMSVARAMQSGRGALRAHVAAVGAAVPGVVEADVDALMPPGDDPAPDLTALLAGGGGKAARRSRSGRRHPVLVVAGGPRAGQDLTGLRRCLPRRSLVVATVEGAGAALARGRRPDVVVGDARRASDQVLAARPAVVHLAAPTSAAADLAEARERLDRSGVASQLWRTALPSEEAAVVLAVCVGAPLTVVAGAPHGLLEAADRPPSAAAAAMLVRAAHGHALVDAVAAARFTRRPLPWALAVLPVAAGAGALTIALGVLGGWSPADGWAPGPVVPAGQQIVELVEGAGDVWSRVTSPLPADAGAGGA